MKNIFIIWIFATTVAITSSVFATDTITSTKTIQEIDVNGNIVNKTYITKTTTSSVATIKNSLVETSVQNEKLLFDALQEYRKTNKNKNNLKYSSKLADVSRSFAKELSVNGYFTHITKEGKNGRDRLNDAWMKENTYRWEVLAQAVDPKQALDAFKSSKSHNAIILEDVNYNIVWVGYYQGTRVVMLFTDKNGKYVDQEAKKQKSEKAKKKSWKKKIVLIPKTVCTATQWMC